MARNFDFWGSSSDEEPPVPVAVALPCIASALWTHADSPLSEADSPLADGGGGATAPLGDPLLRPHPSTFVAAPLPQGTREQPREVALAPGPSPARSSPPASGSGGVIVIDDPPPSRQRSRTPPLRSRPPAQRDRPWRMPDRMVEDARWLLDRVVADPRGCVDGSELAQEGSSMDALLAHVVERVGARATACAAYYIGITRDPLLRFYGPTDGDFEHARSYDRMSVLAHSTARQIKALEDDAVRSVVGHMGGRGRCRNSPNVGGGGGMSNDPGPPFLYVVWR